MLDLSQEDDRDVLADKIKNGIDAYCEKTYTQGHRDHLGASLMGEPCSRKLWYNFRWVKAESFSGRMLRLFQVGHNFEPRAIQLLRGIGFEVFERDPATGKQFRISGCNDHYGGSLDGIAKAPESWETTEPFLLEFKTNGTGAGYANVAKNGMQREKPKHYAQLVQYGKYYQIKYALYVIENKNDSDITIEIVPLDWNYGTLLENKAKDIIEAKTPPARISDNPAYQECKFCSFVDVCHNGECVEINCRSCKFASPVAEGQWHCSHWNAIIPKDAILKGCDSHSSVNE
jgi:hypothetical protein